MKSALLVVVGVFVFAIAPLAGAQSQPITVKPNDVKWTDITGLPGWKQAILVGDPQKEGPYVERIKIPPNALVEPHSHPDTENLTVLTGTFGIGSGTKVDKSKGQVLGAGSFYLLPANAVHFAWAGPMGATIQIHGVGPSGMNMIEPAKK